VQRTQKKRHKGRVRWDRDPQEQIHGDVRSKRARSRGDAERKALEAEMAEIDEILKECEVQ
jgi:hypothetical protein